MRAAGPRSNDPALAPLIDKLVAFYNPRAIYLFGSRARGDAQTESDYDVYVVVPDETPVDRLSLVSAYQAVRPVGIAVDIIPCRQSVFERRRHLLGTIAHSVHAEGVRVYGA